ncbi:MAG: hypothetical protein N2C12_19045, partial [Planctomycetales bacterium]
TLPDQLDPCDFLIQHGSTAFQEQLDSAVDALDHKIRITTADMQPGSGSHQANRALEDILATVAKAPRLRAGAAIETKMREEQFLARLAREFRVPEETIRARLDAIRRSGARSFRNQEQPEGPRPDTTVQDSWERELIEILIQRPETASTIAESITPEQLVDPVCRQVLAKCHELSSAGETPNFDRLLLEFDDPAMKNLLVELDERGQDRGGSDLVGQLPDLLASFRLRNEKRERQHVTAAIKEKRFEEGQEVEILQRILDQKRAQQKGKAK